MLGSMVIRDLYCIFAVNFDNIYFYIDNYDKSF